jgi:hypothetical protein
LGVVNVSLARFRTPPKRALLRQIAFFAFTKNYIGCWPIKLPVIRLPPIARTKLVRERPRARNAPVFHETFALIVCASVGGQSNQTGQNAIFRITKIYVRRNRLARVRTMDPCASVAPCISATYNAPTSRRRKGMHAGSRSGFRVKESNLRFGLQL